MATRSNNLYDDLVSRADIVEVISSYISVNKQGRNYRALCPFHDDVNPSLMISTDKQIFKCFVCGTGGNALTFITKYEKLSYKQAAIKLGNLIGYQDERLTQLTIKSPRQQQLSPYFDVLTDLNNYYVYSLMTEEGKEAYDYLKKRGLDDEMIQKYQLGYGLKVADASHEYLVKKGHVERIIDELDLYTGTPKTRDRMSGRVVFPITNIDGQIIGYSGRILDEASSSAKYVNSSESKVFQKAQVLFNLANANESARRDGYVYVVEGFMDVFALDKVGITSAVALMGTAFSREHIKILRRLNVEIRLALDPDNAGQLAMMNIGEQLSKEKLDFRLVASGSESRDLDEILEQDGSEAVNNYVNNLVTYPEFALNYHQKSGQLTNVRDRRDLVAKMMPIFTTISSPLILEEALAKLASVSGFELSSIKKTYDNYTARNRGQSISHNPNDYYPERQLIHRYTMPERHMLQAMVHDKRAVEYYSQNVKYFYDEIYRTIADYLLVYYKEHDEVNISQIINELTAADDLVLQDEVIQELSSLALARHVPEFSLQAMEEYKKAIDEARFDELEKIRVDNNLEGKSEAEQVAIMNEFNKKRAKVLADRRKRPNTQKKDESNLTDE